MKFIKHFIIWLIVLMFNSNLLSQSVVVQYHSYNNEILDVNSERYKNVPNQLKEKLIKNEIVKYKDYFTLKYSNGKSSYVYNKRVFESEPEFKSIGYLLNYYNDFDKKEIVLIADWIPKDYQVVRKFDEIEKVLLEDTITINSFLCKKAEVEFLKGRKAIVWYTPEIPVMAGPSWYFGLPGLVIRVEINNFVTEAIAIKFPNSDIKIEIPHRKNSVLYKDYRKGKAMEWISEYDN